MKHLHANRDQAMSCIGYFTGAHGANHFSLTEVQDQRQEVAYALRPLTTKTGDGQGQSSSEFPLGLDFMPQSEGPSLVEQIITSTSLIVDREMAEPSDFDHDSFAASEFAAGLGGGR